MKDLNEPVSSLLVSGAGNRVSELHAGSFVEQRVPITWTACHFGGQRPWFGRRVLYLAGKLFACRRCYGLAYASRRKALYFRDIDKAQKNQNAARRERGHVGTVPRQTERHALANV